MINSTVLLAENSHVAFSFGPTPMQVMRDAGFALEQRDGQLRWQGVTLIKKRGSSDAITSRTMPLSAQEVPKPPWDLSPR